MWYTYDELKRVTKRGLTNLSGALNTQNRPLCHATFGTAIAPGIGTLVGLGAGLLVGYGMNILSNYIKYKYIDDIVENN